MLRHSAGAPHLPLAVTSCAFRKFCPLDSGNSVRFAGHVKVLQMAGAIRRAFKHEQPSSFEGAVDNRARQVVIMQDLAPLGHRRLVGRHEDGLALEMPVVDDVEEDVGGIGAVAQIANFVDDEDVWRDVLGQRCAEAPGLAGGGQVVDEFGGGDEAGSEAVLDGAVGDGDGEVGLASAGLALEDQAPAFAHEFGTKEGAEVALAQDGLEREVVFLDGLQERKVRVSLALVVPGLGAVSDFGGAQADQKLAA